jgi:hypothetical protein
MGLMKVYSGSEVLAIALQGKLEEAGVETVKKDNIQSSRLGGFPRTDLAVEIFYSGNRFCKSESSYRKFQNEYLKEVFSHNGNRKRRLSAENKKSMQYKMLVLDMDDTLLTDDHKISDLNKKVLLQAQAKGVYVVWLLEDQLAMTSYAKELELDLNDSYIISFNGAIISQAKDDQVLFEQKLTVEQIHDLYDYSVKTKTHIITYLDDEIISETDSEYMEVEKGNHRMAHRKVANFKDYIDRPAVKCILLENPAYLKSWKNDLIEAMPFECFDV